MSNSYQNLAPLERLNFESLGPIKTQCLHNHHTYKDIHTYVTIAFCREPSCLERSAIFRIDWITSRWRTSTLGCGHCGNFCYYVDSWLSTTFCGCKRHSDLRMLVTVCCSVVGATLTRWKWVYTFAYVRICGFYFILIMLISVKIEPEVERTAVCG